jgi:hypothetical protein
MSNIDALAKTRSRRLIMSGYRNPWRAQECLGCAMVSTGLYGVNALRSSDKRQQDDFFSCFSTNKASFEEPATHILLQR